MSNSRKSRRDIERSQEQPSRAVPATESTVPMSMDADAVASVVYQESYAGPLPPAHHLQAYEDVLPGLANRIVLMAEAQGEHRRRLERIDLRSEHLHVSAGQVSAFLVAIFFGWVAWDLGRGGEPLLAAFIGAVDLVALVSVFVYGRRTDVEQVKTLLAEQQATEEADEVT